MLDLRGFNENQIKAVNFIDGACCVIAGAGSGKTRVLTYRIANMIKKGIKPYNICAMTFTKKASEEMKERLAKVIDDDADEVWMGTFHSICYRILRDEWRALGDTRANAEIANGYWQKKVVKEIMANKCEKYPKGIGLDWQPKQALSFIGFQKNNHVKPSGTLIIPDGMEWMEDKLRLLYKYYEERKAFENKLDFDDMLIMCHDMFEKHPDILERYRRIFQYILVDEFQDTNLVQAQILEQLAGEHKNLFVVGDDYQSIYGFRAARVDLIINFEKNWDAEVILLDTNYRSTANIVEWSNKLIKNNANQYKKNVQANQVFYKDPTIIDACDEDEESCIIADEIVTLMNDGYQPKDFAILYRTNAQSRALEESMMRNKMPYVVLGSANFYERREIKDMLAYLRLTQNTDDDESLERIINTPNRFLGKAFIENIKTFANRNCISLFEALIRTPLVNDWKYKGAKELHRIISELGSIDQAKPATLLHTIRRITDYDNYLLKDDAGDGDDVDNDRIENLNSLATVSARFNTVHDFLEYIDGVSSGKEKKDETDDNKVKLMSIHRSKGLEFPVVFVAGVSENILPHKNCQKPDEIEEERRLCYVAMTRAKKLLYISYTYMYQMREAGQSIFIDELLCEEPDEDKDYGWL